MANEKIYKITVNGISESIDAVKSLEKELFNLEQKIKELESRTVNVRTTGTAGTGGGGAARANNVATLNEEEAAQREINKQKQQGLQLDAKIIAAQDESYKRLDATKELYKSVIADQKSVAAQERLIANEYTNTMQGMKQHLADIKSVINVTDLGDSDKIKDMTKEANELTNKLKKMEEAYGQFGRNVGNYKSAVEGFAVAIGDTVAHFDNAKQALKELKKERDTLSTKKDLGLISEEEAQRLKDLIPVVAQLKSSIADAGKPMDALMDTMQSFVAIAQASKGIGAFFGIDDTEIQKSIQQLVALQNAMQGLQTIQKQIQSGEGVGGWIKPFIAQIDIATAKTLKFNTALLGTGKAAKVAAVGIKTFSKALKVAFSAGVLIVVDLLIEGLMDLVEKIKNVSDEEKVLKESTEAGAKAYAEATAKISAWKTKLEQFNGTKAQEKKLVEELNSEMGSSIGQYKTIAQMQKALTEKAAAYAESMKLQAQAQALLNAYSAQYVKIVAAQQDAAKGGSKWQEWLPWNWGGKSAKEKADDTVKELQAGADTILKEYESINKKVENINKKNGLFEYAPQVKKNEKNTEDALKSAQNSLNNLQLRLMQDGLNKKLRQLDEEERQTLDKLKKLGKKTAKEQQKVQETYNQLRLKETKDYLKKLEEMIVSSAKNIRKLKIEVDVKDVEITLDKLKNEFSEISRDVPGHNYLVTRTDVKNIIGNVSSEDIELANMFDSYKLSEDATQYNELLEEYLSKQNDIIKNEFEKIKREISEDKAYDFLAENFERDYKNALSIIRSYGPEVFESINDVLEKNNMVLASTFNDRTIMTEAYYHWELQELRENIKKQEELEKKRLSGQTEAEYEAERQRFTDQINSLSATSFALDREIELYEQRNNKDVKLGEELKNKRAEIQKQIEDAYTVHAGKMQQITDTKDNNIKKIELDTAEEISSSYEKYYNIQLTNYREFQSKLNNEINKNPVADKNWGIINATKTKKNYKEIINASKATLESLMDDKRRLNEDYKNELIKDEVFNETITSLTDLENDVTQVLQETNEKSKMLVADFIQSIDQYIQAVVGNFNQIMQAVWNAEDTQMDKESEQLDEMNKILADKLSKQQEIVEQHKSKIDSIEDELATARGDRRQRLIDQLNAEMRAQREAAAQEKKLQKQKEANDRKQEDLEKERKKQQYKRDMLQAVVNGAMAVTYALVNKWPIPALPMAALAASTAAAQIGIMAANKPYAKGGLLEGPSHAQGGIPVGNTGIEVEGKEYVIRKKSTSPNIDILDYINKSERKLNLDDFIQFYSSGNIKKTISSMSPRSKFADGGTIPTLRTDIDINDRLIDSFDRYSNRPVVVSVQDINTRQKAVRNVQVLAGLE